ELYNDENGIIWPDPIAPFDVLVIPLDIRDSKALEISRKMVNIIEETHEVLFDDRDVGPGFKFKDADLIGIPVRVVVGPRSLKEGKVEVSRRDGSEKIMIEPGRVQEVVEKLWKNGKVLRKKSGE
ncbi:proline--tRNA ligase, partial [candidate division WOR-3 bacterium]|nr:proline--tRNA ligase [candidate division WOR-3 bacterium]